MATAPIQYKSELEPLLAQLMGSKEKTSGSTSTSSTSSTANVDPLQQIFQQQAASSTPAGMEDLIQEVFRIGAQKTPELSAAYANAVGARTSNNSPLALSLAELQRNLAGQAAQLVGKQQESAAQTANGIAQATAGKTTTATTGGSTVTKGAGGGANPLAAMGVIANLADKTGLLGKLKGSLGFGKAGAGVLDANATTAGYDAYDFGGALNTPSAELAPEAASFAAPNAAASGVEVGGAMDFGNAAASSLGLMDTPVNYDSYDFGSPAIDLAGATGAADAASAVSDTYDAYDFGGSAGNATSWFDDFGSFFADGGLVNVAELRGKHQAARGTPNGPKFPNSQTTTAKNTHLTQKYADGGMVRHSEFHDAAEDAALRKNGSPGGKKYYADGGAVDGAGVSRGRSNMGPAATQQRSGAMNYQPPVAATPADQLQSQLSGAATMASRRLPPEGATDGPDMGDQMIGSALNFFGGPVGWGVNQLLNGGSSVEGNIIGQVLPGVVEGAGEGLDTVEEAGLGVAGAVGDTVADIAAPIGDAFDNTFGGVVDSIGGFFDMFADGGKIEGAGNGVSDSIPAMLSDGEFVFSKDVVDAVGVDFLQKIQDKYHTPAATQKRTGVK